MGRRQRPDRNLGTNGYGLHINLGGTMVLETVLTFLLVLVVLVVTSRTENASFAGLAIGIALTACHLVAIPLDGTSVNAARSFGPALFEGGRALSHRAAGPPRRGIADLSRGRGAYAAQH